MGRSRQCGYCNSVADTTGRGVEIAQRTKADHQRTVDEPKRKHAGRDQHDEAQFDFTPLLRNLIARIGREFDGLVLAIITRQFDSGQLRSAVDQLAKPDLQAGQAQSGQAIEAEGSRGDILRKETQ